MTPLNTPIEIVNSERKLGTENAHCIALMFEMLNQKVSSARVLGINEAYVPAALMDRGVPDSIWYSDNSEIDHVLEGRSVTRKKSAPLTQIKHKAADLIMIDCDAFSDLKFTDRYVRSIFSNKAKKLVAFYNTSRSKVNINAIVRDEFPSWELWRSANHKFGILVFKKK